jgi:hypothetical protein
MKEIIKEILSLVQQFFRTWREREKKNKTDILRVRSKQKKKLLLKKNMDL